MVHFIIIILYCSLLRWGQVAKCWHTSNWVRQLSLANFGLACFAKNPQDGRGAAVLKLICTYTAYQDVLNFPVNSRKSVYYFFEAKSGYLSFMTVQKFRAIQNCVRKKNLTACKAKSFMPRTARFEKNLKEFSRKPQGSKLHFLHIPLANLPKLGAISKSEAETMMRADG